jgi:hypothetical protein
MAPRHPTVGGKLSGVPLPGHKKSLTGICYNVWEDKALFERKPEVMD